MSLQKNRMDQLHHGVVHGNSIELDAPLGLSDGQRVEVVVRASDARKSWGDGLRRCAGALSESWTDADDAILSSIQRDR
jgi:hypothetical protein